MGEGVSSVCTLALSLQSRPPSRGNKLLSPSFLWALSLKGILPYKVGGLPDPSPTPTPTWPATGFAMPQARGSAACLPHARPSPAGPDTWTPPRRPPPARPPRLGESRARPPGLQCSSPAPRGVGHRESQSQVTPSSAPPMAGLLLGAPEVCPPPPPQGLDSDCARRKSFCLASLRLSSRSLCSQDPLGASSDLVGRSDPLVRARMWDG